MRATTTTDANGYWAISHATEGRFDVEIVNGSSKRRIKYDDSVQLETVETAVLRMRNPADTFDYDIVPAAITADRQLNLPLLTGTDTMAVLALAQAFITGVKTFYSSILAIRNPADTFSYTIVAAAIAAARNLTLPLLTADDVWVTEAFIQTLTNKRITKRTGTVASSATPTINTDNVDYFSITALAVAITSMTTNLSGTPTTGQTLVIRILDDGTARAITCGASFVARGVALPTTTVLSKYLYVGLIWNNVASVWDCIASSQES